MDQILKSEDKKTEATGTHKFTLVSWYYIFGLLMTAAMICIFIFLMASAQNFSGHQILLGAILFLFIATFLYFTQRAFGFIELSASRIRLLSGLRLSALELNRGSSASLSITRMSDSALEGPQIAENTVAKKGLGFMLRRILGLVAPGTFAYLDRGSGVDFLVLVATNISDGQIQRLILPGFNSRNKGRYSQMLKWLEANQINVKLDETLKFE